MSASDFDAVLASDTSDRLYQHTSMRGGWLIRVPSAGAPDYEFTPLVISRSAVHWQGFECVEVPRRGLFGGKKTELRLAPQSLDISNMTNVEISKGSQWPAEQHFNLTISGKGKSQMFDTFAADAIEQLRAIAAIFKLLGIDVRDRHDVFWQA